MNDLVNNLHLIHTTPLGVERIRKNLGIKDDPIEVVKDCVNNKASKIILKGKNYYVSNNDIVIVINKHSYTVITAHIINSKPKL